MHSLSVRAEDPDGLIGTRLDGGVLVATIDMPGRTMNVFSWVMMDALDALMDRIERDEAVTSVVITSGKSSFLAGADLDMVRDFTTSVKSRPRAEVCTTTRRLGRQFVRLEALAKPTVAAINGLAFGGGLELTMACSYRIVADDPRIQLGTPEVLLGLLPGAGGTQRLPRLIGTEKGLEYLLSGKSIAPRPSLERGLVDEMVPRGELLARATAKARELAISGKRRTLNQCLDPAPFDFNLPGAPQTIASHFGYPPAVTSRYPAYLAIVRAVIEGANMPIAEGNDNEMERFLDLISDPTAGRMVTTLFIDRQRADKQAAPFAGVRDFGVAMTASGPLADAMVAALGRAKVAMVHPDPSANLVIVSGNAASDSSFTLLQTAHDCAAGGGGLHLRHSLSHGSVLEIVLIRDDERTMAAALTLAGKLRATPFVRRGSTSFIAALAEADARTAGLDEDRRVEAMAITAEHFAARENIGDRAMADVAAVVSGLFPAYAGGPFAFANRDGVAWA